MSRQCIISEPFKREHKRKRISELEIRTGELQERLRSSSQPGVAPLPESAWTAVNDHRTAESDSRLASVAPFFRDATIAPVSFRSFSQAAESLQTPESLAHDLPSGTLPRSLEGQIVDAKDIDALFQLYVSLCLGLPTGQSWLETDIRGSYFRDFAGFMPVLDQSVTPNAYYALSPFLFWAIIGVGCRSYHRNPTLLGVLPSKIQTMALFSLNSNLSLQVVQGLLLILFWPFPKASTGTDMTFPLSAALLHMAMQLGLHLPASSQEFSKVRIRLTENDTKIRAEVWGYCMLVYQR